MKDICNIYNSTIKDNDFTLKIGANGRKFLETSSSLPPSLSPTFKHRSYVHEKASSATALAVYLIGSLFISNKLFVKSDRSSWNLPNVFSILTALILCFSSVFFKKHAKTY
ncbi:MAG: hypothetical protein JSS09_01190 [Verrucomicrobia bacterium]|nr:hypothetical protein [Verrucomicrobiota bacterium]